MKYLEKRKEEQPIPKGENAFRHHPLFVLEKHLTKYQYIHPRTIIGLFKVTPNLSLLSSLSSLSLSS